jgi:hypothetical protein
VVRGARLRLVAVGAILFVSVALTVGGVELASSQTASNCPYPVGSTLPSCGTNPNPHAIPQGLGGNKITNANCANAFSDAIASMYSYDDRACYSAGNNAVSPSLKFVDDVLNYLPPEELLLAQQYNFSGTLYCDTAESTLILAFRGSTSLTSIATQAGLVDWYNTNLLQHVGPRPIQYRLARDSAWLIEKEWRRGSFNQVCASDKLKFVVSGHSKAGGQAQYAAVQNRLDAVVFNSDLVNPVIYSDWALSPNAPDILEWIVRTGRSVQSLVGCATGHFDASLQKSTAYYATGRVRDVRMVNDPIVELILPYCQIPHAPIEWLVDTFACSAGGYVQAHAIDTVVRELKACLPAKMIGSP